MRRAATSRADLVRLLKALPEAEWPAAARALGFAKAPDQGGTGRGTAPAEPGPKTASTTPAPTEPYRPADLADLPFWRIAAEHTLAPDPAAAPAPAWLTRAAPWDELPLSDPACPRPEQAELVPCPRQARFLRRHLAGPRGGGALDLERLCRLLAECRLPPRLPRRPRPRWPARVDLVLDLALPLRPYWEDFWHIEAVLRRLLGRRLRPWHARAGDPHDLVSARDGRPGDPPWGEGAVVVLGDAGLHAPGSGRHRRWQRLGRQVSRAGVSPLLIAPVPPRRADAGLAQGFRLVPWDRGAPLHPLRQSAAPSSAAPPPPPHPGSQALLAALAHASRVEPPLLRDLRLALADQGADIGSEYEVWNHAQVRANILACALDSEHRGEAAASLRRLPPEVQRKLAGLRHAGNRHQSPLIRAEEALADGPLAPAEARRQALDLAQRLCATLDRGGDPVAGRELAGYVAHLGTRRPELLASNRALATAWAIARRDELRARTLRDIPPGVDLAAVRWLLEGRAAPPVFLAQVGDALGVFPAAQAQPACRLADLETGADYWEVREVPEGSAPPSPRGGRAGDAGSAPRILRPGETLPLAPERRYRLTLGRWRLELEVVRRPAWALGLGRDAAGLFAEPVDGRRLYWVPQGWLGVADGAGPGGPAAGFDLPHGFWWDQTDHRAWLQAGRVLAPPAWAARHGIDAWGWWAEFDVKGLAQRMRWVPPGEFLMGSPENEPERFGEGDWGETQHPVLLTQGFWLADTACTQALWQAVLGETPSRFKGAERPVEQVSWDDVVSRFLPALNRLVPGLAAVLPSEAQWEYACRAGTATPFWFGANIATDQVNYDGDYPYAGGPRGESRQQTVEVKALPANAWGLYQLHGNVWEWCADWLGDYPRVAAIDPEGPPEGRERVLRGGGWISNGRLCRSAFRYGNEPDYRLDFIGFRLARGSSPPAAWQAGSLGVAGVAAGDGAPAAAPASPRRGRS